MVVLLWFRKATWLIRLPKCWGKLNEWHLCSITLAPLLLRSWVQSPYTKQVNRRLVLLTFSINRSPCAGRCHQTLGGKKVPGLRFPGHEHCASAIPFVERKSCRALRLPLCLFVSHIRAEECCALVLCAPSCCLLGKEISEIFVMTDDTYSVWHRKQLSLSSVRHYHQ